MQIRDVIVPCLPRSWVDSLAHVQTDTENGRLEGKKTLSDVTITAKVFAESYATRQNSIVIALVHAATELKMVAARSLNCWDAYFVRCLYTDMMDRPERNQSWKRNL